MFNIFLTLISSIFPFLKELVLGNQTVRDALMNNKLMVFMAFLFIFIFGSNLYTHDINTYLKNKVDDLTKQLAEKTSSPPSICPPITPKVVFATPSVKESIVDPNQGVIAAKDARIKQLEMELSKKKHTSQAEVTNDPLDRLYK
jgi:hypothetical protein